MLKLNSPMTTALALALLASSAAPAAASTARHTSPPQVPIVRTDGGHLSATSGMVVTPPPVVPAPVLSPPAFSDIRTSPFYTEINWMKAQRITSGYSDGTFRPNRALDRGAAAVFLYRMAGSPDYTAPAASSFADVQPGRAFYKEIHWAVDRGLLSSTPQADGTHLFRGSSAITRAEMAQAGFIYSGASKTYRAPLTTSKFADVRTGTFLHRAVHWVDEKGISKGFLDEDQMVYRPSDPVTREVGAGFLYQLAHKSIG